MAAAHALCGMSGHHHRYPQVVPANEAQSEPDVRPLGFIAVGFAVLSTLLALSVVLSPLAFLPAAIALPLGFIARREEQIRGMGTVALMVTLAAVLWAIAMVFVISSDGFGY